MKRRMMVIIAIGILLTVSLMVSCKKETSEPPTTSLTGKMAFIRNGNVQVYDSASGDEIMLKQYAEATAVDVKRDGSMIVYATSYTEDFNTWHYTIHTMKPDGNDDRTVADWYDDFTEAIISISCSTADNYAYFSYGPHQDIYGNVNRIDLDTGVRELLVDIEDTGNSYEGYICSAVSPDGRKLACIHITWKMTGTGMLESSGQLCVMNSDASDRKDIASLKLDEQVLSGTLSPPSWSISGDMLAYMGEGGQIWKVGQDGDNPEKVTASEYNCNYPDCSPDGGFISFNRLEFQVMQGEMYRWVPSGIYCVPFSGGNESQLTDQQIDQQGCWFAI